MSTSLTACSMRLAFCTLREPTSWGWRVSKKKVSTHQTILRTEIVFILYVILSIWAVHVVTRWSIEWHFKLLGCSVHTLSLTRFHTCGNMRHCQSWYEFYAICRHSCFDWFQSNQWAMRMTSDREKKSNIKVKTFEAKKDVEVHWFILNWKVHSRTIVKASMKSM